MTPDCGDWYKFTFPSSVSASSLIFNDGTKQTADLKVTAGKKYYDGVWLTAEPEGPCQQTLGIEENDLVKSSVLVHPNPVSRNLNISSNSAPVFYQIIGILGNVLQEGSPNDGPIDVSALRTGVYVIKVKLENGKQYFKKFVKE